MCAVKLVRLYLCSIETFYQLTGSKSTHEDYGGRWLSYWVRRRFRWSTHTSLGQAVHNAHRREQSEIDTRGVPYLKAFACVELYRQGRCGRCWCSTNITIIISDQAINDQAIVFVRFTSVRAPRTRTRKRLGAVKCFSQLFVSGKSFGRLFMYVVKNTMLSSKQRSQSRE